MPFCGEHIALAVTSVRGIQIAEIANVVVANGAFRDLLFTGPRAGVAVEHHAEPVSSTPLAIAKYEIQLTEILRRIPRSVVVESLDSA